jgi:rhamnopyranosyl-N-acetylglucosaminyl-diphospho-decaprenol beta-1,3/1,4-galactofuranosyltransferase
VSFNRRDLLREALAALAAQTRAPDALVVVDNGSTDGSPDLVRAMAPTADLVETGVNTGGAGGFAIGMQRAVDAHAADLVWVMDDDTVPEPTALAELLRGREAAPKAAMFASRPIWTDGRPHPMNVPRHRPHWAKSRGVGELPAGMVPIRTASFVSLLVRADLIRRRGLPIASYFIWNDDFEFSARMARGGYGLLCPDSVVVHKTKALASSDLDPGERFFYEVRNKLWTFRFSPCFRSGERLLYMAATLRRWVLTFVRSADRGVLWRGLRAGLPAGLRRPPGNDAYFRELGVREAGTAA